MSTTLDTRLKRVRFLVSDVDGVLTDGAIAFDGEGRPFRTVCVRDVTALTMWHLVEGKTALVSGLGSKALEAIAATWKCAECHMWVKNKLRVCEEVAARHGLSMEELAFIGDDIIDVRAISAVGLGVAVADAAPEARQAAHFVTGGAGGKGAVRELIEHILRAQGRYEEALERYMAREDSPQ
ncbi:MAG TPA: HAD hydrolase family protein [Candidatus Hydrogenedentes bacterium]|nr:HAD hydrolase family protein [Candidatus Hydrogenedentota bacterium]HQE83505.1 HAD hydrolase family protein [Candidatus Hydrogenedentota bacterium]HQH51504.1 HAD hydrolase family protein [Candidatus Hydrogenedentota bacterium]HQM50345.1 HAD hydrolase family protein [Candidatus Hydrogenedentota bacterium]